MNNLNFVPASPTFNDLIGNGRVLEVPRFQRDYSWQEEEWADLWADIEELTSEPMHYMGYVVLQSTGDIRRSIVFDGQQRITTLSILAAAVIGVLDAWASAGVAPETNRERMDLLEKQYIGLKTASALTPTSKLHLNRNNDDFYKSYIVRRRQPANLSRLKPSEKRLWSAFEFFTKRLHERFDPEKNGEQIATFLEREVGDRLIFTSITVGDDVNAYKVFETLNARGVKLSTGDLLKNFLFSEVARTSQSDIEEAEGIWQRINDSLQRSELPVFIRHFWSSRYPLETKSNLFKSIKSRVQGRDAAFGVLQGLEGMSGVYAALDNEANDLWNPIEAQYIEELALFGATQCYTVLLAAFEHIRPTAPTEFVKILRDLAVSNFRYTTIGQLNANTLEKTFNTTAMRISKREISTAIQVFRDYGKEIYVPDEQFANYFSYRSINANRNKELVRYILCKIEQQLANKVVHWNDNRITLEHILPENAPEGSTWENAFGGDAQETYKFRIGNLTLMEGKPNHRAGTLPFAQKMPLYQKSQYVITNSKINYTDWTPGNILHRQRELANAAKTVWKVGY